jgi:hypothetical protein
MNRVVAESVIPLSAAQSDVVEAATTLGLGGDLVYRCR